jgi:hypothetical protein
MCPRGARSPAARKTTDQKRLIRSTMEGSPLSASAVPDGDASRRLVGRVVATWNAAGTAAADSVRKRTLFDWRQWSCGGAKLPFDGLNLAALPQPARGSHRFYAIAQVLKLLKELGIRRGFVWH